MENFELRLMPSFDHSRKRWFWYLIIPLNAHHIIASLLQIPEFANNSDQLEFSTPELAIEFHRRLLLAVQMNREGQSVDQTVFELVKLLPTMPTEKRRKS